MYPCQAAFGVEHGGELHRLVEAATEAACPCLGGGVCPIIPVKDRKAPTLQLPVVRAAG